MDKDTSAQQLPLCPELNSFGLKGVDDDLPLWTAVQGGLNAELCETNHGIESKYRFVVLITSIDLVPI